MKWHKKEKVDNTPKDYEKRVIIKFLLFPKEINSEYRWLEKVKIEQIYYASEMHECRGIFGGDSYYFTGGHWYDVKFID